MRRFPCVGHPIDNCGACIDAHRIPVAHRRARYFDNTDRIISRRFGYRSHRVAEPRGVANIDRWRAHRGAADQRDRFYRHRSHHGLGHRQQRGRVLQIDATRVAPSREKLAAGRQRGRRLIRCEIAACLFVDVVHQQLRRYRTIGDLMDERCVGAVFKQPPHEIGEQIAKLADRRVYANTRIGLIGEQRVVQRIAHAVQPLKLVATGAGLGGEFAREFDDRCNRQRVMCRKLRIYRRWMAQQAARYGQKRNVGRPFARKYGEAGHAELVRALDLGVPVGALDEPDRNRPAQRFACAQQVVHCRKSARLIRLHRKPQSGPVTQQRLTHQALE